MNYVGTQEEEEAGFGEHFIFSATVFNSKSREGDSKIIWGKLKGENRERRKSAIHEFEEQTILELINKPRKQGKLYVLLPFRLKKVNNEGYMFAFLA